MRNWLKKRIIKLLTVIGLSGFYTQDKYGNKRSYRVDGYYYCYNFKDGSRKFVRCHKLFANMIGGYGVAGCYIPFEDVGGITFSFRRWFFFKESVRRFCATRRRSIKRDLGAFKLMRSMPKGLTEQEYSDIAWEKTWKDIQKDWVKN